MPKNSGTKRGRPPKGIAGDTQARILDAAQQLFIEKGYRSTSIDEISENAPASKPTIYAHFAGKDALFAAVVARTISELTDWEGFTPEGRAIQDKLASLGTAIVERAIAELLGILRATIAEAPQFPDLSRSVHEAARDRSARSMSQLLNDATSEIAPSAKGPFSAKRNLATAQIFLDLIVIPMLFRSLLGDTPKNLKKELPAFMRERVSFFLAACEVDWQY